MKLHENENLIQHIGHPIKLNSPEHVREFLKKIDVFNANSPNLQFGDYVTIEQKRYGAGGNEFYQHKVIGTLESNTWVDVPVQTPATATNHKTMEPIALVICCGIMEDTVYRVRVADCKKCIPSWGVIDSGNLKQITHEEPLPAPNTVMWWLCRIADDEVRRKAVVGYLEHGTTEGLPFYNHLASAIDHIDWIDTDEGFAYWADIYGSAKEIALLPSPEWKEYLELKSK